MKTLLIGFAVFFLAGVAVSLTLTGHWMLSAPVSSSACMLALYGWPDEDDEEAEAV